MNEKRTRRRFRAPSPALVISCLALMVALSGTGYAVTVLPRNSVGTVQLKNDAVNSAKVKPGSLLGSDFAAGQLPAGAPGPTGPKGDKGDAGTVGLPGPAGAKGDKGEPGLRWRGAFVCDGTTIYQPGDVVSRNGSSWVNGAFPIGGCVDPPNDPWKLLASKGDAGAAGPQGSAGPTGPTGPGGPQGPQGAQGPPGPQGPQGPAGANGISGYEVIFAEFNVNGVSKGGGAARCSPGKKVLGGGVRYSDMNMLQSSPAGDVGGWEVQVYNGSVFGNSARVYAVCANV